MQQIDLSFPQRQSKKGLTIIFFNVLKALIKTILPLILVFFFREHDENKSVKIGLIFAVVLALILILSFLNFWFFKFYINSKTNEFIIEKGWLNKSKTVIKFDKIQQVNLNQNFLHRLLNLYSVEVETAGSTKTEGQIYAVSGAVAHALKLKLLEREDVLNVENQLQNHLVSEAPKQKNVKTNFIKISLATLIKVGITRNYLQTFSLLFVLFFQVVEKINDFYKEDEIDVFSEVGSYAEENMSLILFPFFFVGIIILVLIINLVRTLLKYFNYKIDVINKNMFISYGLLDTKNTIIKAQRVQILKYTQNYFQKLMDISIMKILQADSEDNTSKKGIGIDIPGVNKREKNEIINQIFRKEIKLENGIKPSIRKFVVHFIWFSIFPTLVYLGFSWFQFEEIYIYLTLPIFILTALYQWITYKNAFFYFTENFIVKKSGFWDVTYAIIEPHKIQKIYTSQRIWHLNLNLGSVVLYTAGGVLSFSIADEKIITNRVNYWLYNIEKRNLNWM